MATDALDYLIASQNDQNVHPTVGLHGAAKSWGSYKVVPPQLMLARTSLLANLIGPGLSLAQGVQEGAPRNQFSTQLGDS